MTLKAAMTLRLSRDQLYELVWAKPRTAIAKELGVSDVRVGMLCRDMNVAVPPRGYWAAIDGKRRTRKYQQPPLTYTVAGRIEADHDAFNASRPSLDSKNFESQSPSSPVIPYSFERSRATASS